METTKQTLFLIRGLPGSGKSTLAKELGIGPVFEADQYFVGQDGVYRFHPSKIQQAHKTCQENTKAALSRGENVVVANTFNKNWEIQPYEEIAVKFNVKLVVIDLDFGWRQNEEELAKANIHSVPFETIMKMSENREFYYPSFSWLYIEEVKKIGWWLYNAPEESPYFLSYGEEISDPRLGLKPEHSFKQSLLEALKNDEIFK